MKTVSANPAPESAAAPGPTPGPTPRDNHADRLEAADRGAPVDRADESQDTSDRGVVSAAVDTVKAQAGGVAEQVGEVARGKVETVRTRVAREAEKRRLTAAGAVGDVASATRQMATQLRDSKQDAAATLVERAADAVDASARYLRERDLTELAAQAGGLARRHPLLVAAGGLAAGFAATVALKVWSDAGSLAPADVARAAAEKLEHTGA